MIGKKRQRYIGAIVTSVVVCLLGYGVYLHHRFHLPQASTIVTTSSGEVVRRFMNDKDHYKFAVPLDQVSDKYLHLLINYEDADFYQHYGVKPSSLARAAWQLISHGSIISGGSTITMQLARIGFQTPRTWLGKFQQIIQAIYIELRYSKPEILQLYVNNIAFGGNLRGIEAAARRYFGKSAKSLSIAESAILAVIPQRPSLNRPDKFPNNTFKARNKLLAILARRGVIDKPMAETIAREKVVIYRENNDIQAPIFARYLKQSTTQSVIKSTLNAAIQFGVNQVIESHHDEWGTESSVSIIVVENATGKILAYRGSADFLSVQAQGQVDMGRAIRSPGSTLKPFIYAIAIDKALIHSKSLLIDAPTDFAGYRPKNIDGQYQGKIAVDNALRASKNIAAVQLLNAITAQKLTHTLKQAGVKLHHQSDNLSIALGGTGASLLDLVTAYQAFGNRGKIHSLMSIDGEQNVEEVTLISASSAYIVFDILSKARPHKGHIAKYRRTIAWKTGTSYGFRDAWTIGVSHDYTVGVWLGKPSGAISMGRYGRNHVAPIMFDVFDQLPKDRHRVTRPQNVETVDVCWPSGKTAAMAKTCALQPSALIVDGFVPYTIDKAGQYILNGQYPIEVELFDAHDKAKQPDSEPLDILWPKNGTTFFKIDLPIQIRLQANKDKIRWYQGDKLLPDGVLTLPKDCPSKITITACDIECDHIELQVL